MDKREQEDLVVEIDDDQLTLELPSDDGDAVAEPDKEKGASEPKSKTGEKDKDAVEEVVVAKPNDEAVEALRAQIKRLEEEKATERLARQRAEKEAAERLREVTEAKGRLDDGQQRLVASHIQAAKSRASEIKREIKSAYENAEYDRLADLQAEQAQVAARLLQYEDAKRDLDDQAERAKTERDKSAARTESSDPFEARIATLSEPSKAWLRDHRECVMDEEANARVIWGDKLARKQGIQPDTKDYFTFLEKHMGYLKDAEVEPAEEAEETEDNRPSLAAAPVTRQSAGNRLGQVAPGKYRLSREEADMAEALGMTPTEYATHKIKAIKDGRFTNNA